MPLVTMPSTTGRGRFHAFARNVCAHARRKRSASPGVNRPFDRHAHALLLKERHAQRAPKTA